MKWLPGLARGLLGGAAWLLTFFCFVEPVPIRRLDVLAAFVVCPVISVLLCEWGVRYLTSLRQLVSVPLVLGASLGAIAGTYISPGAWLVGVAIALSVLAPLWVVTVVLHHLPGVPHGVQRVALASFLVFATSAGLSVLCFMVPGVSGVNLSYAILELALPFSAVGIAIGLRPSESKLHAHR